MVFIVGFVGALNIDSVLGQHKRRVNKKWVFLFEKLKFRVRSITQLLMSNQKKDCLQRWYARRLRVADIARWLNLNELQYSGNLRSVQKRKGLRMQALTII